MSKGLFAFDGLEGFGIINRGLHRYLGHKFRRIFRIDGNCGFGASPEWEGKASFEF